VTMPGFSLSLSMRATRAAPAAVHKGRATFRSHAGPGSRHGGVRTVHGVLLLSVLGACAEPSTGLVRRPADAAASAGVDASAEPSRQADADLTDTRSPDAHAPDAALDGGGADGGVPDLGVPDAGAPPTTGCFAAERTLATATSVGGARAHLAVSQLLAREQGWVLFYEGREGGRVLFLGPDGEVLGEDTHTLVRRPRSIVLGDVLIGLDDVGIQRLDLGLDRVARSYPAAGLPDVMVTAGRVGAGLVRRIGTYYVGNVPQLSVTDLELSSTEPTGLARRSAGLEDTSVLGYLSAFRPHLRGELLQLLGSGSVSGGPWRVVTLGLGATPVTPGMWAPWQVVQDVPWGLAVDPESVFAQSDDGRWAIVLRGGRAEVEPLPVGGVLPAGVASPALSESGVLRAVLDSAGSVSLLFQDRLLVLDAVDLALRGELRFEAAEPQAAQRRDRAAAAYVVGDPEVGVRVVLRCTALVE
jgi:hypothetical protein